MMTTTSPNNDHLSLDGSEAAMSVHNHHDGRNHPNESDDIIAKAETRCVLYLRILTFGFLMATTIAVACGVHQLLRRAERRSLDHTFHDTAHKVHDAVGHILRNTFTSVDQFGTTMTSYSNAMMEAESNVSWPFVTIPDFAVRASKLRSLTKIFLFSIYHYVRHVDRAEWERYASVHKGWIDEGIATQRTDDTFRGNLIEDWYSSDEINFQGQRAADAEFYLARWQASPVLTRWDAHSWNAYQEPLIHDAMQPVLDKKGIVISTSYNIDTQFVFGLQDFVGDVERATQPAVEIFCPVTNYTSQKVAYDDRTDEPIVAIMGLSIFWQDIIEGILPIGNNGLIAVFDNAGCNQTFTFQINGPTAEYLGLGDLHDEKYNDLVESSTLSALTSYLKVEEVYSGPPLVGDFCPYSLTLYASETMAQDHITSDPITFAFIAVAIFVFTSMVFLLYDAMIEKRQRKVMLSATRSSAIVSSLFPSTIRSRLYQESAPAGPDKDNNTNNQITRIQNFMHKSQESVEPINTGPIADLFESTTVLFADIKGFTKWSSSRDPTQVFTLLETLYGAYDELAEKWGVYKIETIGDSYVAVCGLPEPRKDHAVAMTKFAVEMRRKTNELVEILRETLGEGTETLVMRIGMHSGPTTGGVLRGQRARFQLFGDTVNVAARMESNGEGNKIQVSEKTANLLMAGGKGAWLEKREDLITAKGKGQMQTYWVNFTGGEKSS